MDDIRKYINIVTEAQLPGKYTYKDDTPEEEDINDVSDLVKQAYNVQDPSLSPEDVVYRKDLRRIFAHALAKFPKIKAMMFLWHYVYDMGPSEIAVEKLNKKITPNRVMQIIHSMHRHLRMDPDIKNLINR